MHTLSHYNIRIHTQMHTDMYIHKRFNRIY